MQHFTLEEVKPSDYTLHLIRQIAHSYRAVKNNGRIDSLCLN